ncbi:MAG: isoprenylcysteine carboxyl methyltransferase [Sphingomonas sp.]|nr:isoprenylcysteine carboxyl methyltransferase [Sphingomonas sp.]
MSSKDRGAAISFPPPLVYLGLWLAGLAIERFVTLPRLGLPWPLGAGLAAAGLALIAAAIGLFRRRGENPEPWTPTNAIVDTGIYGWTRNPMYMGMAIVHLGLALAFDSVAALTLLPVAMAIIQTQVIAREEAYLREKFGTAYTDYCGRVRRWL